jgi:antitoxin CptB
MSELELTNDERRLQWHCRRGLKELDVFLGPFMEHHYRSLSAEEKAVFTRLVACEDMDLFNWFMQQDKPDDPAMERMIEQIRRLRPLDH